MLPHRDGLLRRRHPSPLFQDSASVLPPADFQFPSIVPSALWTCRVSSASRSEVRPQHQPPTSLDCCLRTPTVRPDLVDPSFTLASRVDEADDTPQDWPDPRGHEPDHSELVPSQTRTDDREAACEGFVCHSGGGECACFRDQVRIGWLGV